MIEATSRDNHRITLYPRTQQRGHECGLNPDYAIRVVAKQSFGTSGHALGGLSKRLLFSSDYKKITFLAKAVKIFIFCRVQFGGSKRGVISENLISGGLICGVSGEGALTNFKRQNRAFISTILHQNYIALFCPLALIRRAYNVHEKKTHRGKSQNGVGASERIFLDNFSV